MDKLSKSGSAQSRKHPRKNDTTIGAIIAAIFFGVEQLSKWQGIWSLFNETPAVKWLQQRGVTMRTIICLLAVGIIAAIFRSEYKDYRAHPPSNHRSFWIPWCLVGTFSIISTAIPQDYFRKCWNNLFSPATRQG